MDFYIARQPIFTRHKKVYAYELLYRGASHTPIDKVGGDRATTSLLSSTFITEGIDNISNTKPCFINFTRNLLLENVPHTFPNNQVVVEVLEDIPADKEVIKVCQELKAKGYTIALDDFVYDRSLEPLIEIADIIKFDIIATPLKKLRPTLYRLSRHNLKYLAEKVETNEEYELALKMGFHYFQGFFFKRPENIKVKELNSVKLNLVQLLAELNRKDWTIDKLTEFISRDVSLSYKLLRYINSAYFYRLQEVKNINHAIAYLGEKELKRFVLLIITSEIATEKPNELVRLALTRAKFCELLAAGSSQRPNQADLFVLGLFSLLDTMLDFTMEDIIAKIPLDTRIKDALIGEQSPYTPVLQFTVAYEQRDKETCLVHLKKFAPIRGKIHEKYLKALEFANSIATAIV